MRKAAANLAAQSKYLVSPSILRYGIHDNKKLYAQDLFYPKESKSFSIDRDKVKKGDSDILIEKRLAKKSLQSRYSPYNIRSISQKNANMALKLYDPKIYDLKEKNIKIAILKDYIKYIFGPYIGNEDAKVVKILNIILWISILAIAFDFYNKVLIGEKLLWKDVKDTSKSMFNEANKVSFLYDEKALSKLQSEFQMINQGVLEIAVHEAAHALLQLIHGGEINFLLLYAPELFYQTEDKARLVADVTGGGVIPSIPTLTNISESLNEFETVAKLALAGAVMQKQFSDSKHWNREKMEKGLQMDAQQFLLENKRMFGFIKNVSDEGLKILSQTIFESIFKSTMKDLEEHKGFIYDFMKIFHNYNIQDLLNKKHSVYVVGGKKLRNIYDKRYNQLYYGKEHGFID